MNRALIFILLFIPISISAQVVLGDPTAIIYSMDIQSENRWLAAIVDQKKVELWNYEKQILLKRWELDSRGNAVAIVSNTIAVAKANGVVDVYDALTFERVTSQKLTDNIPLLDMKMISGNSLLVTDSNGSVYKSDSENGQMVFRKLFTAREPISQFDFISDRNAIITLHQTGLVLFTSLEGELLSEQQLSEHNSLAVKYVPDGPRIYASFKNGEILGYNLSATNVLTEVYSSKISQWPVALDCENRIVVAATTGGGIKVHTDVGTYRTRLDVLVNIVRILPEQMPQIVLALGTHGGGIRIISARDMKFD